MKSKAIILFVSCILLSFSISTAFAYTQPQLDYTDNGIKYTVSMYCRSGQDIRYEIRETSKWVTIDAKTTIQPGAIVGYVTAKGAKYLPEEMKKIGYERWTWSYTSWFGRFDFLPLGISSRGCQFRD